MLIRLDLPTFERPAKAISGKAAGGYWDCLTALVTNSADLMIMGLISGLDSADLVACWFLATGFWSLTTDRTLDSDGLLPGCS